MSMSQDTKFLVKLHKPTQQMTEEHLRKMNKERNSNKKKGHKGKLQEGEGTLEKPSLVDTGREKIIKELREALENEQATTSSMTEEQFLAGILDLFVTCYYLE